MVDLDAGGGGSNTNSAADADRDTCSADSGANSGPTDGYCRTAGASAYTTGATASKSAGADR